MCVDDNLRLLFIKHNIFIGYYMALWRKHVVNIYIYYLGPNLWHSLKSSLLSFMLSCPCSQVFNLFIMLDKSPRHRSFDLL
jgi:hypothetical protein